MINKRVFFFLLVLGIAFEGMGGGSVSLAESNKGRVYVHPSLGFKIFVPDGYQTSESYVGKLVLWNGPSQKGFPAFGVPYLSVQVERTNGQSLAEKIEALRSNMQKIGCSILEDKSAVLKNSHAAHILEFTQLNPNTKDLWKTRVVYVLKDDHFIRVGVTAIESDWRRHRTSWIKILESFED
jgi:hypothetical protein